MTDSTPPEEATEDDVVLALEGVSRVYGTEVLVRALDDVSLEILSLIHI